MPQVTEPDRPPPAPAERAVTAALAVFFASPAAISATELPEHLVLAVTRLGISRTAAVTAGWLTLSVTMAGRTRHGMPLDPTGNLSRRVRVDEPVLRARYLLAAARRLDESSDGATTTAQAVARERRWLNAHVAAGRRRRSVAAELDRDHGRHGWRWMTAGDSHVGPECAALEGEHFTTDNPIQVNGVTALPGAMHGHCRCTAIPIYQP
jgi:hypothetical protein